MKKTPTLPKVISVGGRPPGARTRQHRARNLAVAMLWNYLHSAGYAGRAGATRESRMAEIAGIVDNIITAATTAPRKERRI